MKTCTKCKVSKSADQFHRRRCSEDGLQSWCKSCMNAAVAVNQTKNLERVRETTKAWAKRNAEYVTDYRRKNSVRRRLKRYGISREAYDAMMEQCQGKCMICRKNPDRTLHIDHCHKTGRVRGLLCGNCNTAIGKFGDDPAVLAAAASYLRT